MKSTDSDIFCMKQRLIIKITIRILLILTFILCTNTKLFDCGRLIFCYMVSVGLYSPKYDQIGSAGVYSPNYDQMDSVGLYSLKYDQIGSFHFYSNKYDQIDSFQLYSPNFDKIGSFHL
jgi:hypothetical protein